MDKQITRIKITPLEKEFEYSKDTYETPSNGKFFVKNNSSDNQDATSELRAIEPPLKVSKTASLTPPTTLTTLNSSVPITRAASIMVTNAAKNIKRAFTVSHQNTNNYNHNTNNNNRRSNKLQRMEDTDTVGDNDVDMEGKTTSVAAAQSQSGQRKSGTIVQLIGKSTKLTACVNGDRKRSDSVDSIIVPENCTKNDNCLTSTLSHKNKKTIQILSNTNCNHLSDDDRRSEQKNCTRSSCLMKEKMDNTTITKDSSKDQQQQQRAATRTTSSNSISETWSNENRFLRRSSIRKFLNHLAQHLAFSVRINYS